LTYKAPFTKSFLREYRKLPQEARERIEKAILEIVEKPYSGTRFRGRTNRLLQMEGWRLHDRSEKINP
jgi:mRNA-degrading endonuclease RelE of RelBE toxin-antitoxin system